MFAWQARLPHDRAEARPQNSVAGLPDQRKRQARRSSRRQPLQLAAHFSREHVWPPPGRGQTAVWTGSMPPRPLRVCAKAVESAGGAVPVGGAEPTARGGFRLTARRGPPQVRLLHAAHRTGRAGFPHPALGQISPAGIRPQEASQLDHAEVAMHLDAPKPGCSGGQLVPPSQEVPRTCRDVDVHDAERRIGGVVGEVARPSREALVELATDVLPALLASAQRISLTRCRTFSIAFFDGRAPK